MKKILILLMALTTFSCGWLSEAEDVAQEEFGARGSLNKYEWFKDCAESITEKRQTIMVYESNLKLLEESYEGTPRKDWDRLDKQQYNQWQLEIVGIKASYNKIVKEYNAQSSKFNWDMYNTEELPRSYDLYISK